MSRSVVNIDNVLWAFVESLVLVRFEASVYDVGGVGLSTSEKRDTVADQWKCTLYSYISCGKKVF